MKVYLIPLLLLFNVYCFSQSYSLPKGYGVYHTDGGNAEIRADGDFDGDGVQDLAILCKGSDNSIMIAVFVSSEWDKNKYWYIMTKSEMWHFTYENSVLTMYSYNDDSYDVELKFRYSKSLENMRLIGYGEYYHELNSYGNQITTSSKSINLATGKYEKNGVWGNINLPPITLGNIEDYFAELNNIGGDR